MYNHENYVYDISCVVILTFTLAPADVRACKIACPVYNYYKNISESKAKDLLARHVAARCPKSLPRFGGGKTVMLRSKTLGLSSPAPDEEPDEELGDDSMIFVHSFPGIRRGALDRTRFGASARHLHCLVIPSWPSIWPCMYKVG